jgi:hypothetical protein
LRLYEQGRTAAAHRQRNVLETLTTAVRARDDERLVLVANAPR